MASRQPSVDSPKEQQSRQSVAASGHDNFSHCLSARHMHLVYPHKHTHRHLQTMQMRLASEVKHKHFESRVKYSNKYYKYALWLWLWLWLWHWQEETRQQLWNHVYARGLGVFCGHKAAIIIWATYSHGRIRNLRNCFICLHVFENVFSQFRFFRWFSHTSPLLLVVWFSQAINTQGKHTKKIYRRVTSWNVNVINLLLCPYIIGFSIFVVHIRPICQCLQTRVTFPVAVGLHRGMCCMYV